MEGDGLDAARNVKIENRDLELWAEIPIFVVRKEGAPCPGFFFFCLHAFLRFLSQGQDFQSLRAKFWSLGLAFQSL